MEDETKTPSRGGVQAFPVAYHNGIRTTVVTGMSLEDWFAGQAIAAMIAAESSSPELRRLSYNERAARAYKQAIAMTKVREEFDK